MVLNDCDLNIEQNNHHYDFYHNQAVLYVLVDVATDASTSDFFSSSFFVHALLMNDDHKHRLS